MTEHAWPAEQAPQHELGQSAHERGQADGERQREPVVELEVGGELDQEHGRDDADLALGEVQDPVGPVDQHEAEGEQPVAEAVEDPLDEDEVGRRERQEMHGPTPTPWTRCPGRRGAGGRRGAMSSAVGPSKRISPRSMKKQRSARLSARLRLCSTRITVVPPSLMRRTIPMSRSTVMGASPSASSSIMRSRGVVIITRDSASICCSPPESVPAGWSSRSASSGNASRASS